MRIAIVELKNRNIRHMSPVFAAWLAIQSRGPVCERWQRFTAFAFDVGPQPTWRHLLVRDDPRGEFGPSNARWQVAKWYRRRRPTARNVGAAIQFGIVTFYAASSSSSTIPLRYLS
ncbi:hypothetical protein [Bradyrhizobium yuanmingense]|uniref:hypothetical protein n=1 Tax=Bradyrhizobium yuanmingense TaxID=108015 RepID=UPI0012E3F23E|nr:hypothetical protein [Bradyrhizobium yuanmingense]